MFNRCPWRSQFETKTNKEFYFFFKNGDPLEGPLGYVSSSLWMLRQRFLSRTSRQVSFFSFVLFLQFSFELLFIFVYKKIYQSTLPIFKFKRLHEKSNHRYKISIKRILIFKEKLKIHKLSQLVLFDQKWSKRMIHVHSYFCHF